MLGEESGVNHTQVAFFRTLAAPYPTAAQNRNLFPVAQQRQKTSARRAMPSPHIAATALIDGAAVSPLSLRRGYRSNKSSEGSSSNEGSREASREASRRPSVPAAARGWWRADTTVRCAFCRRPIRLDWPHQCGGGGAEAPRDDGSAANKLYTGATGESVSPAARIALKQSLRNIKTAEPPSGARPPSPVVGELPGER